MQIVSADLPEEAIHLHGVVNVLVMDHTQRITRDPIALKETPRLHDPVVRRLSALGEAVAVVESLRAIQAQTDEEPVRRKKTAPGFIQQSAIRL